VKLPSATAIAVEKLTKHLLVQRTFDDRLQFLQPAGYTLDNWEQLWKGAVLSVSYCTIHSLQHA